MGSVDFITHAEGATAQEAFDEAVHDAQYNYGPAGCTGTIAEKTCFVPISGTPMSLSDAEKVAVKLLDADDVRISDKAGPAGVIPIDDGSWLFFGWAKR